GRPIGDRLGHAVVGRRHHAHPARSARVRKAHASRNRARAAPPHRARASRAAIPPGPSPFVRGPMLHSGSMCRWAAVVVVVIGACSKASDEAQTRQWPEPPPRKEVSIPAELEIAVTVDGAPRAAIT